MSVRLPRPNVYSRLGTDIVNRIMHTLTRLGIDKEEHQVHHAVPSNQR